MTNTCFILLLINLTVSDLMTAKAKLCEKPSKTWFGVCKDEAKFDKQCIDWEGAEHGTCHQREAKYMCFCYEQCRPKGKNPPKGGQPSPPNSGKPGGGPPSNGGKQPAPPSDGGKPAPSPGGGQSPPSDGGQPAPPPAGTPAPPPGGGQPSPPDGGQPAPPSPDTGKPAPPPGCNRLLINKLIAEALAKHKTRV